VLQTLIDDTQKHVNGWVAVKLYKGNVIVVGRDSKTDSLFDPTIATFETTRALTTRKTQPAYQAECAAHAHCVQTEAEEIIFT